MKPRWLVLALAVGVMSPAFRTAAIWTGAQSADLPTPGFHHLHMNSPHPSAAIAEFLKVYPGSTKVIVAGVEGLRAANGVYMLFTKVSAPPPAPGPDRVAASTPQTAFW